MVVTASGENRRRDFYEAVPVSDGKDIQSLYFGDALLIIRRDHVIFGSQNQLKTERWLKNILMR